MIKRKRAVDELIRDLAERVYGEAGTGCMTVRQIASLLTVVDRYLNGAVKSAVEKR